MDIGRMDKHTLNVGHLEFGLQSQSMVNHTCRTCSRCEQISFIIRTNSFALNVGMVVYCSKSCSTFVASDGNTFENMNKYIP